MSCEDAEMDGSGSEREEGHSLAWLTAWSATLTFGIGALLFAAMLMSQAPDPYAGAALVAAAICLLGAALLGVAELAWVAHLLLTPSTAGRRAAAIAALVGAAASWAGVVAGLTGPSGLTDQTWPFVLVGVSLLALGAIIAADVSERRPARVFAGIWLLFVAGLAFRVWTDTRVEVLWLGPTPAGGSGAQVAFDATRSGNYEVRFGAHSCADGRAVARGRYEWRPRSLGQSFGAAEWVDLPVDVLPLRAGDLVRVCLREGLATGTAAGEVVDPPSFWPRP
jgi:hypothetical protein